MRAVVARLAPTTSTRCTSNAPDARTIAPLLPIDRVSSPEEPIPESFILWTLRTLTDSEYKVQIVRRNLDVCRRFFSLDALERQLREVFTLL